MNRRCHISPFLLQSSMLTKILPQEHHKGLQLGGGELVKIISSSKSKTRVQDSSHSSQVVLNGSPIPC